MTNNPFDLSLFLPYLFNQVAEKTSREFEHIYKADFSITRPQWRVMANLGKYGAMSASDICKRTHQEKSKVSRAVFALEEKGLLERETLKTDRRFENLQLTDKGHDVFNKLGQTAMLHNQQLQDSIGHEEAALLTKILSRIIENDTKGETK